MDCESRYHHRKSLRIITWLALCTFQAAYVTGHFSHVKPVTTPPDTIHTSVGQNVTLNWIFRFDKESLKNNIDPYFVFGEWNDQVGYISHKLMEVKSDMKARRESAKYDNKIKWYGNFAKDLGEWRGQITLVNLTERDFRSYGISMYANKFLIPLEHVFTLINFVPGVGVVRKRLILQCPLPKDFFQLQIKSCSVPRQTFNPGKIFGTVTSSKAFICAEDLCKDLKADKLSTIDDNMLYLNIDDAGCVVQNGTEFQCTAIYDGFKNSTDENSSIINYSEDECRTSRTTRTSDKTTGWVIWGKVAAGIVPFLFLVSIVMVIISKQKKGRTQHVQYTPVGSNTEVRSIPQTVTIGSSSHA